MRKLDTQELPEIQREDPEEETMFARSDEFWLRVRARQAWETLGPVGQLLAEIVGAIAVLWTGWALISARLRSRRKDREAAPDESST